MMSFLHHLRLSVWDYVLVLVTSCALSGFVATGFLSGDAFAQAPLEVIATCVISLLVLYSFGYSKYTAIAGIVVVPVLTVLCMLAASAGWSGEMFADEVGNPCPPLLASIVSTLLVYLLSRRRPGIVVLSFGVIITCGYLQFIYKEDHVILTVLVLFGCLSLLAFRGFTQQRSESKQSRSGGGIALAICLAFSLVMTGLGCGVYAAVIAPLNPPAMELKLIKEYLSLPTLDATGIADSTKEKNEENKSDNTNEDEEQSSGKNDQEEQEEDEQDNNKGNDASKEGYDSESDSPGFMAFTHTLPPIFTLSWIILIVIAFIAVVMIKRKLRQKKLDDMMALPPDQLACEAYCFFMKRGKKLGLPPTVGHTPSEYAQSCKIYLDSFDSNEGSNFSSLTEAYVAVAYGKSTPTNKQLEHIYVFYDNFYAGCREHLGLPKYLLLYFFI